MILTYEDLINRIAEKTIDNTSQLRKSVNQRRNGMVDLYGTPFSASGDASHKARFYISISPDIVYYERFAFKLAIEPFKTMVTGGTDMQTVTVNTKSLSVSGGSITPNPHAHTTEPHTHNIVKGISYVNTNSTFWKVYVAGVNITDYLIEQHDDEWIDGEGIYPTDDIESDVDSFRQNFYDILDVASLMYAEGTTASINSAKKLLRPEFKRVEIESDAPFNVTAFLYLKYSHVNR